MRGSKEARSRLKDTGIGAKKYGLSSSRRQGKTRRRQKRLGGGSRKHNLKKRGRGSVINRRADRENFGERCRRQGSDHAAASEGGKASALRKRGGKKIIKKTWKKNHRRGIVTRGEGPQGP